LALEDVRTLDHRIVAVVAVAGRARARPGADAAEEIGVEGEEALGCDRPVPPGKTTARLPSRPTVPRLNYE
jgi:hypothetical protein